MIGGMGTQYIRALLRKGISRNQLPVLVRMGFAIASLVIYTVATVVLNQPRDVQYDTERSSLAGAISNVVYGAPIGTVYTGVLAPLWDTSRPMQQTFNETAQGGVQTGSLLKAATDGNGIGYLVITSLTMRLFGLRLSSLNYALLNLMAVSAVVFLLRFRDGRLLFVPLCFLSLTLMLLTPLVTDSWFATQVPIGGIRYFSLVGILPAMHILLEIAEPSKVDSHAAIKNYILLGVQLLVLATTVVVRNSAGYLIGAICVGFFAAVRRHAGNRESLRNIIHKGTVTAVFGALFTVMFILWIPESYKESGRAMGLVWHRVVIGLGVNPAWPFGNLRDIYQCEKSIPEGLVPGVTDRNGHCIWASYGLSHGLSAGEINDGVYGERYETIMEKAFVDISRLYPMEVLVTFIYYKPMMFFSTMGQLMNIDVASSSLTMRWLFLVQALNVILFVVCGIRGSSESRTRLLTGAIVLFSIFALLPMIVAWSNPFTTADPLFYFLAGLGLGLGAAIEAMRKFIRGRHAGVPM